MLLYSVLPGKRDPSSAAPLPQGPWKSVRLLRETSYNGVRIKAGVGNPRKACVCILHFEKNACSQYIKPPPPPGGPLIKAAATQTCTDWQLRQADFPVTHGQAGRLVTDRSFNLLWLKWSVVLIRFPRGQRTPLIIDGYRDVKRISLDKMT